VASQDFPKPRFHLHAELRYHVASAYLTVKKHIDDPGEPPRPDHLAAASTLGYALGLPLPEIRDYGRRALLAFRRILKERPPLEAFQKPVGPGSWLEYSIGSSSVSLRYMYWALLLREHELAREIAADTWDPPHMGRIRIFPEYRLGYGLRDLILGRPDEAMSALDRLPASAKKYFHVQARAISALARGARAEVAPAVVALSDATRTAMSKEYLPQNKILALPGAGLASYALDHGLMTPEELPRDIDAFPIELVLPRRPAD
jgi:hypothetical protein